MGIPCQDAWAYALFESGLVVVAVADGLGSASRSDLGARTATDAAVQAAGARGSGGSDEPGALGDIARAAVRAAREALEDRAGREACELRDLACTLIVALLSGDRVAVAHVGDGAVVARCDGALRLASAPAPSEYANEVVPLTTDAWRESIRTQESVSDVRCVAVLTDGCQRAALARRDGDLVPFAGFFDPVFAFAQSLATLEEGEEELRALLASEKVCRNSEDDKTLVIAVLGG